MVTNAALDAYCLKQRKPCIQWVHTVFKDCLCDFSDEASFGFGFISLVCWVVAGIPQIITNYNHKSAHGLSFGYLLPQAAGDIFNLIGCILEPATLPTQFYLALLYTIFTAALAMQSMYYNYVSRWLKNKRVNRRGSQVEEDPTLPLKPNRNDPAVTMQITPQKVSSQIRDVYYRPIKSGPSVLQHMNPSSEDDEDNTYSSSRKKLYTKPLTISRSVGYGTFLVTSANVPFGTNALIRGSTPGRRLLNEHAEVHSMLGVWLGWMMAVIYMGSRIPQIFFNIKRGSVEGMNPLMFIFTLVGNATYVGSIIVRSTEWKKIKPNLPWLLDAVGCVVLDMLIILQYIYYRYYKKKQADNEQYCQDYVKEGKPM